MRTSGKIQPDEEFLKRPVPVLVYRILKTEGPLESLGSVRLGEIVGQCPLEEERTVQPYIVPRSL
jgi:hypothetical protein